MWKNLLDHLYDSCICAFSFIDIFCDVFVTVQFYRKGHMIFFWISAFILFLAQICYDILICFSLEPVLPRKFDLMDWKDRHSERTKRYIILFICVLPFGQLVPLYLMIANAFPKQFNKFYKWCGYKNVLNDVEKNLFCVKDQGNDINKVCVDDDDDDDDIYRNESDPLSVYIRHKLMSHLGFIIEAIIEAIPQSILQMVFLIMYSSNSDSVSIINLISIFMSMIVVVSKGTILSYSIYRSAAIFNFLCFAADIFGIFCVVSWLFCADPQSDDNLDDAIFEYEMYGYKMWSSSYYYFSILKQILKFVFIGGICTLCLALNDSYRFMWNHPWRQWIGILIGSFICTLIFFPIALICLMIRFTLLPLLVLRVWDHSQNRSFQFYNKLFSFLTDSSSIFEIHEKLLISHYLFAKIICINTDYRGYYYGNYTQFGLKYNCGEIQKQYEKTETISLSFIYSTLGCPALSKYHQIIEILSLLFSRKALWGFLFVRIIFVLRLNSQNNKYLTFLVKSFYYFLRFLYVPLDINDISFLWNNDGILTIKQQSIFDELEKEFYKTVEDIQQIINWKNFTKRVKEIIDDFLNTDWKEKWRAIKREIEFEWNLFRNQYNNNYIKTQIIDGIKWFFVEGLFQSIKQDIINIYNTIQRKRIQGKIRKLRVEEKKRMKGRKGIKFRRIKRKKRKDSKEMHRLKIKEKKYYNQQILTWNLPRCWMSFSIMFGSKGSKRSAFNRYDAYWSTYKYSSNSLWIGRGIWVYFVVIIYKCIHTPIRWFIGSELFAVCAQCIGVLCGIFAVILTLILAIYSMILPILFLFQHWYHYGFLNIENNTLQIILTGFYLLILGGIIGLFSRVWKFVYCDVHLFRFFGDTQSTPQKYADFVIKTYDSAPIRKGIVLQIFGQDIGGLLLTFLPKWHILNDNHILRDFIE